MQETSLSALYIYETQHFLRDNNLLQRSFDNTPSPTGTNRFRKNRMLLWQLIYTNILVIVLDIALLGIQYADMFYLQGAFKPCVYGVKLRVEFVVLNRLIKSVGARRASAPRTGSSVQAGGHVSGHTTLDEPNTSKKGSWWSRHNDSTAGASEHGPSQNEVELGHMERAATRGLGEGYPFERHDSEAPIIN